MADLVQNFNKGLDSYLTKDQLKEVCPVAFKDAPTNPKVTDKYLFVNTETIVDDLDDYDHDLCSKMRYEHNANVNFAKIEKENTIKVRTYERGVEGETLACGTGMAACFLRANNLNLVSDKTFVYPKSDEELTLSLVQGTIYFKGAVKNTFTALK